MQYSIFHATDEFVLEYVRFPLPLPAFVITINWLTNILSARDKGVLLINLLLFIFGMLEIEITYNLTAAKLRESNIALSHITSKN
jgi:hypothetical protein